MKRLMTLMLALAFLSTTAVAAFAQDAPKKEDTKQGKKKGGKKKSKTPKKDGGA